MISFALTNFGECTANIRLMNDRRGKLGAIARTDAFFRPFP